MNTETEHELLTIIGQEWLYYDYRVLSVDFDDVMVQKRLQGRHRWHTIHRGTFEDCLTYVARLCDYEIIG